MVRVLTSLLLIGTFSTHSAAFDCSKATTNVERQICSEQGLSELDDFMAKVYAEVLESTLDANQLAKQQRSWLAKRNACKDSACLHRAYEVRTTELACSNTGSAIGSIQCSVVGLKFAERALAPVEKQHAQAVVQASNNPEYAASVLAAESKAWLEYRSAKCALYGETEGGSDGWKNAFASMCEVSETKRRISEFGGQPIRRK